MEKEMVISRRKKTWAFALLSSGFFSFYMLREFILRIISEDYSSVVFLVIAGVFGTTSLYWAINAIRHLLNKTPALIINSKGITDNISSANSGFIAWNEIDRLDIKKVAGKDHLIVYLFNDERIMKKLSGFKKQLTINVKKKTGSPIALNPKEADFDIDELEENMNKLIKASRGLG